MSAVATRSINSEGILAAMGIGTVKRDFTALVAINCIRGPCCLVPAAFEPLRHLGKGQRDKGENDRSDSVKHFELEYPWTNDE